MAATSNKGRKFKLCENLTVYMFQISIQYFNKNIGHGKLTQMTNTCSNQIIKSSTKGGYLVQS